MRIISGTLKGRELLGYNIEGTRPTMDRVKESIFGMIQNYLIGSTCLDLFAGSGNLGFEAISNGASICYFIDSNNKCIKKIIENKDIFKLNKEIQVLNTDYKIALKKLSSLSIKFNMVFIDPPYKDIIIIDVLERLHINNVLDNKAIIVVEMEDNYIGSNNLPMFELIKNKKYGVKYVNIYQYNKFLL